MAFDHSHPSNDWLIGLRTWLLGAIRSRRDSDQPACDAAVVEFLESREVLTSITGLNMGLGGSAAEAAATASNVDADQALAMAVQSDGKIILVGSTQIDTSGNTDFAITRLNADGSLDTTFGTGGKKTVAFDIGSNKTDGATCVVVQSDGKIVVGGYAQISVSGNYDFAVIRLNADGSLDDTFSGDGKQLIAFDVGGVADDRASAMTLQSDGKIVIVGTARASYNQTNDFAIARLTTSGALDNTFSGDGKKSIDINARDDRANAVTVQADGRIIIVGAAQLSNSGYEYGIVRLTTSGAFDKSFAGDGKKTLGFNLGGNLNDQASAVAVQADGTILLAGTSSNKNGGGDFTVARLKSNGSTDTRFGSQGKKFIPFDLGGSNNDQLTAMAVQSDGKIVLSGISQIDTDGDYDFASARLLSTGALDTTYSDDGKKTVSFNTGGNHADLARAVVIQSDGKILQAGSAMKASPTDTDFAVTRLTSAGAIDTTFGTDGLKTIPFDLTPST